MTRPDSWIERTDVFDAYNESPYHRLAQVLKGMGQKILACISDQQVLDLETMAIRVPSTTFVPAPPVE